MSFDDLVEKKIQEAMARGEFDDLAGQGKPIDQDAYFRMPEELRAAQNMLKSAGFLPEELSLLKEVHALEEQLAQAADEQARLKIQRAINDRQLKYDLLMDAQRARRRTARKGGL